MDAVEPARFFALAYRLPVYEGVLSARVQEENEKSKKHSPAKALRKDPEAKVVDITAVSEFIDHK